MNLEKLPRLDTDIVSIKIPIMRKNKKMLRNLAKVWGSSPEILAGEIIEQGLDARLHAAERIARSVKELRNKTHGGGANA